MFLSHMLLSGQVLNIEKLIASVNAQPVPPKDPVLEEAEICSRLKTMRTGDNTAYQDGCYLLQS